MTFYGPQYGFERGDWMSAACAPGDARTSLRDLDRFRGVPRLWLLSSGARPFLPNREAMSRYLAAIGQRRDQLTLPSRVMGRIDLELWDLSVPDDDPSARADTFAVTPWTGPPPRCREWAQPDREPSGRR